MSPLPISLVIPTHDHAHLLPRMLPTCLAQDVAEILVVDDGSRVPIEPIFDAIVGDDPRARLLRLEKNRGSSAARNAGAAAAKSEFVLFVDDDTLLAVDYAATLHAHLKARGADAAAGRRLWLEPGESTLEARFARRRRVAPDQLVERTHFAFDDEADFEGDVAVPMACAIMLIRRSWFRTIRYDEQLYRRSGFREETDLQIQLARAGGKLLACSHALCFNLPKSEIGPAGGQRKGRRLAYEWHLLCNDAAFRRKHFAALSQPLGFHPGATPWLGALHHYFGYRVPSKVRRLFGRAAP